MNWNLHLVVHASAEPGPIRVEAQGRLSDETVSGLVKVLARAATLDGCTLIRIDLSGLTSVTVRGCELLAAYICAHGKHPRITVDTAGLAANLAAVLNEVEQTLALAA